MIQRIQSLYFLLALVLQIVVFTAPLVVFSGDGPMEYDYSVKGLTTVNEEGRMIIEKAIPLAVTGAIIPFLLFLSLFMYKKRKLQMRVAVFAMLLTVGFAGLVVYYLLYFKARYVLEPEYGVILVLPLVSLVLTYLGHRGVLKDDLLIGSYDRLR